MRHSYAVERCLEQFCIVPTCDMAADCFKARAGGDPRDLARQMNSVCQCFGTVAPPAGCAGQGRQDRRNHNGAVSPSARCENTGWKASDKSYIGCDPHRKVSRIRERAPHTTSTLI